MSERERTVSRLFGVFVLRNILQDCFNYVIMFDGEGLLYIGVMGGVSCNGGQEEGLVFRGHKGVDISFVIKKADFRRDGL